MDKGIYSRKLRYALGSYFRKEYKHVFATAREELLSQTLGLGWGRCFASSVELPSLAFWRALTSGFSCRRVSGFFMRGIYKKGPTQNGKSYKGLLGRTRITNTQETTLMSSCPFTTCISCRDNSVTFVGGRGRGLQTQPQIFFTAEGSGAACLRHHHCESVTGGIVGASVQPIGNLESEVSE